MEGVSIEWNDAMTNRSVFQLRALKLAREVREGKDFFCCRIIDLGDYLEEEAQDKYPDLFDTLVRNVRIQKLESNRKTYRDRWWQFSEPQTALFKAI